jgi:hypothetical protein
LLRTFWGRSENRNGAASTVAEDLQKLNDRRVAYIAALKTAYDGDIGPLMTFIGHRIETTKASASK